MAARHLFYSQILNTVTGLLAAAPPDLDYHRALRTLQERFNPLNQGDIEGVHEVEAVLGFMRAIAGTNPQPMYHKALRDVQLSLGLAR